MSEPVEAKPAWILGWEAGASTVTGILTDLIAELKDQVHYYPDDVFPGFTADDPASQSQTPDRIAGVAMRDAWTRAAAMADLAEARLRGVTGDE